MYILTQVGNRVMLLLNLRRLRFLFYFPLFALLLFSLLTVKPFVLFFSSRKKGTRHDLEILMQMNTYVYV